MRQCRDLKFCPRVSAGVAGRLLIEGLESRTLLTSLPAGFSETLIAGGLGSVTSFDLLPDGRVLVAAQNGVLHVVKNGATLPTPFLQLTVDSNGERGLIGVVHDPNFQSNHFIYVYHTVPADNAAAPFNELSRFTADPNNPDVAEAGSEADILKLNDLSGATNHNGGSLHFGIDGMLYIGVGENANPANSQSLSTLLGKVLRIDVSQTQAGDPINDVAKLVPADNPFVSQTAGSIDGAIYALGFRNPFTFAVQPVTGKIYINDVGQSTWEEIDQLTAGRNYGWNLSEGFASTVPPAGLGPGVYQDPLLAYNHTGGPAGGGVAIVGGVFYNPDSSAADPFPSSFVGKYFYEDVGKNWIRVFDPSQPGSLSAPDTSAAFATSTVAGLVDLAVAPDGGLYYVAQGNGGELREISFANTASPIISVQPQNQSGLAGADFTFTVTASGPGTLSYQWQRNSGSNGTFVDIPGATAAEFTDTAAPLADTNAQFRVVVSNSNSTVTSDPATLTVTADQAPVPAIKITGGLRRGKFDAGHAIRFSLSATDNEDGKEPASRFTYQVDYVTSLNETSGGVVSSFVPAQSGLAKSKFTPAISGAYVLTDVLYRITFTVTDAAGISANVTRDIAPNTSRLTLKTHPVGLSLDLDGQSISAPATFDSVVGFQRLLDAPASQQTSVANYLFRAWSDGRPASHTIVTRAGNAIYTARYVAPKSS